VVIVIATLLATAVVSMMTLYVSRQARRPAWVVRPAREMLQP